MRLHGSTELYNGSYSRGELERWARLIDAWRHGDEPEDARLICSTRARARARRDVYCYFDNTDKRHAPNNARELMAVLDVAYAPGGRRSVVRPSRTPTSACAGTSGFLRHPDLPCPGPPCAEQPQVGVVRRSRIPASARGHACACRRACITPNHSGGTAASRMHPA